jgi:predicted N-acetyltransferase YhbS
MSRLAVQLRWLGAAGVDSGKTHWFTRPRRRVHSIRVAYDTVDAAILSNDERAALGKLIVSSFPKARLNYGVATCREWQRRAWRTVPAEFHVAARTTDGRMVGQQSVYKLAVPSGRLVFGLGDLVVAATHRRRGIGRTLIAAAVAEAQRRGADALCTRTGKLSGTFARLEFELDEDGRWFTDEAGAPIEVLWVWLANRTSPNAEPLLPSDF